MLVSGSIGVIILSKKISINKEKIIIILSDDHSNTNYCSIVDDSYQSITEFLDSIKNKQFLIEEIPEKTKKETIQIKELWYDVPHVKELKNYFLNNSKISDGIDIRLELLPFSIELISLKKDLLDFKFNKYIKEFKMFFDGTGDVFKKYFHELTQNNMVNLKIDNRDEEVIKRYFNKLLEDYISIEKKSSNFIYPNKDPTIRDFQEKDMVFSMNLFNDIDDIVNNIMEFYVILNIFSTEKTSIIHMGLFHTTNISKRLMIDYNYNIIYKNGLTNLNFSEHDNQSISCIKMPNLKKFGIY